jgi:uncharacterized protein YabN with tetrapyrrole methylase and pyrophosphatase domain
VVGTGIQPLGQMTLETKAHLEHADRVFHLITDPVTEEWVLEMCPRSESLADCYREGRSRAASYERMVRRVLAPVRRGRRVCLALYGHPGVFVFPSHEAIRRARAEGYRARMLPAVSAEDCLFADLGLDPATSGCQSFEATDFLVRRRVFDPTSALVLWQAGAVADLTYRRSGRYARAGARVLAEVLLETYPRRHEVVVYEAAQFPLAEPRVDRRPLATLARARMTGISTLYVPPLADRPPDRAMLERLGLRGAARRAR